MVYRLPDVPVTTEAEESAFAWRNVIGTTWGWPMLSVDSDSETKNIPPGVIVPLIAGVRPGSTGEDVVSPIAAAVCTFGFAKAAGMVTGWP
jgi:hypothetical protein